MAVTKRHYVPLLALIALAACGLGEDEKAADDTRTAEGEIQGGTISDAMLPLDTLKSQSPPLKIEPRDPDGAETGDADEASGETDAVTVTAPPAATTPPNAAPTPAPSPAAPQTLPGEG